jgi:serine/threonine-protein kinase HipA
MTPSDRLYLWLLTRPSDPLLIGEINLVRTNQGASLRYASDWLERGFPLSEDMPLIGEEFLPAEKGSAAGAVDDARPDRWGERRAHPLHLRASRAAGRWRALRVS